MLNLQCRCSKSQVETLLTPDAKNKILRETEQGASVRHICLFRTVKSWCSQLHTQSSHSHSQRKHIGRDISLPSLANHTPWLVYNIGMCRLYASSLALLLDVQYCHFRHVCFWLLLLLLPLFKSTGIVWSQLEKRNSTAN